MPSRSKVFDAPSWSVQDLSDRERQILGLTAAGLIDKMVAAKLKISIHTVRAYWERIRQKAGNLPRTAVVSAYVRESAQQTLLRSTGPDLNNSVEGSELGWRQAAIYYATALQQVEKNLQMAERAARVLIAYPRLGFQADSPAKLCAAACRILVEHGGYAMAWVGIVERDKEKSIRVGSSYGDIYNYLEGLKVSWGTGPLGEGPAGTAVRTGKTQINRDFLVNPKITPWRDRALQSGFQSSIGMPLKSTSRVVGVLSAYSREPDAFDRAEVQMLEVVANDLALRLEALQDR